MTPNTNTRMIFPGVCICAQLRLWTIKHRPTCYQLVRLVRPERCSHSVRNHPERSKSKHFHCSQPDLHNVTWCWQHKRNALKIYKANLKFNSETYYEGPFSSLLHFFLFLSYHILQGQIATRTQRWYRRAERWRLMSVRSATAHTRRARGRSSVRPPAVRTSASGARDC